jgi:hypothetical protein
VLAQLSNNTLEDGSLTKLSKVNPRFVEIVGGHLEVLEDWLALDQHFRMSADFFVPSAQLRRKITAFTVIDQSFLTLINRVIIGDFALYLHLTIQILYIGE